VSPPPPQPASNALAASTSAAAPLTADLNIFRPPPPVTVAQPAIGGKSPVCPSSDYNLRSHGHETSRRLFRRLDPRAERARARQAAAGHVHAYRQPPARGAGGDR